MGPSAQASLISCGFGLGLFFLSIWFLKTIDIHGNPYRSSFDYAEWASDRRIRLQWGTAASIGITIGLFQFISSLVYLFFNLKEQQDSPPCDLAAIILHVIFLLGIFYSLAIGINGLSKRGGALHITFLVFEGVEAIFLVIFIVLFEKQSSYFASLCRIFTCDEVKLKLAKLSLIKFPLTSSSIRMERLVEERSLPV